MFEAWHNNFTQQMGNFYNICHLLTEADTKTLLKARIWQLFKTTTTKPNLSITTHFKQTVFHECGFSVEVSFYEISKSKVKFIIALNLNNSCYKIKDNYIQH